VLIVGLTGGIGAGKSTVASLLGERGAFVIDVDAIGRSILERGAKAYSDVVAAFGRGILDDAGRIDRAALATIVFADVAELDRLTAISHPAINARLSDLLDDLPADSIVVLDIAVLVESDLGRADPRHSYQLVVTVEAPEAERIDRAVRRGMSADDARRRARQQRSDAERREVADFVIVNEGPPAGLATAVDGLWQDLCSRTPGGSGLAPTETTLDAH